MNFQGQFIYLDGDKGKTEIGAYVAVGVGLAYHEDLDGDLNTYSVTHIASGHNILTSSSKGVIVDAFGSEATVKRFIELIANMVDWHLSESAIRSLNRGDKLLRELKEAERQAIADTEEEGEDYE